MPLTYTIDVDRNLADVRGTGEVTLADAIQAIRAIAADVSHQQCGCLVDVRTMDFFPSIAELKEIPVEDIYAAARKNTREVYGI